MVAPSLRLSKTKKILAIAMVARDALMGLLVSKVLVSSALFHPSPPRSIYIHCPGIFIFGCEAQAKTSIPFWASVRSGVVNLGSRVSGSANAWLQL